MSRITPPPLSLTLPRLAVLALVAVIVSACAGGAGGHANGGDKGSSLSGELVYRQRIALSPEAVIDVRLVDVDQGTVVAQQEIHPEGKQVPIPFRLEYATVDFMTEHQHRLLATVRDGAGRVRWAADTPISVFDSGRDGGIRVRLAQATFDDDALVGTQWRLLRIEHADGSINWASAKQTSNITFNSDGRVGGHAACNGFFASYELGESSELQLGHAGATLMACPQPNLAQSFLQTLGQVESYAIVGNHLRLIAGGATVVLTSEAETAATSHMASPRAGETFVFACNTAADGFRFTTRTGPGETALWLPERLGGRYLVLGQKRAASGARYEGDGVVFWNKGNSALLQIDGKTYSDCALDSEATAAKL